MIRCRAAAIAVEWFIVKLPNGCACANPAVSSVKIVAATVTRRAKFKEPPEGLDRVLEPLTLRMPPRIGSTLYSNWPVRIRSLHPFVYCGNDAVCRAGRDSDPYARFAGPRPDCDGFPLRVACPQGPSLLVEPCALPECLAGAANDRRGQFVGPASKSRRCPHAASEGTIDQEEIATRPLLRPGEVLEAIPGLVISQHSGGGKANQYYLRGFQLDHGTDLEATIDGIPINLPTHAHGQGYSDINWLMPELVSYHRVQEGHVLCRPRRLLDGRRLQSCTSGTRSRRSPCSRSASYGYDRLFTAGSPQVGAGILLYGAEIVHDNGSFAKPDEYHKFNALAAIHGRQSERQLRPDGKRLITALLTPAIKFPSGWSMPANSAASATSIRPTAATRTATRSRVNGSTQTRTDRPSSARSSSISIWICISNFTYYFYDANNYYNETANPITCNVAFTTCTPNTGRRAARSRTIQSYCPAYTAPAGAAPGSITPVAVQLPMRRSARATGSSLLRRAQRFALVSRPGAVTTIGAGTTNYNIPTLGFVAHPGSSPLDPAERFSRRSRGRARHSDVYVAIGVPHRPKLRLDPGSGADLLHAIATPLTIPANSGTGAAAIVSPKINASYEFSPHSELYLDFGDSFHSNDVRGVTYYDDPQTHTVSIRPERWSARIRCSTARSGEEAGYRYSTRGSPRPSRCGNSTKRTS